MGDSTEFARKLITPYAERIEELEEELESIVRCGECRYRFEGYDRRGIRLLACDFHSQPRVEREDYCAWGERGDAE